MKLRNKKTGEVGYLYEYSLMQDIIIVYDVKGIVGKYNSLAELNSEWEDIPEEEPEEIYFISAQATVEHWPYRGCNDWTQEKEIGNYFETKEEAEKAVEKLKAWKRLKDKGFRFDNFVRDAIYFNLDEEQVQNKSILKDLELLFGGEE